MKKKIVKMLLVACLTCQSMSMVQAQVLTMDGKKIEYNLAPITLYVNKQLVETKEMEPIQLNNRVLVPTREVFEAVGAKVNWDNSSKQVTVDYKKRRVILVVNQTTAQVDGQSITMDVPAKIINNKVMIPIRFVSEAIGLHVQWDAVNRAVRIEEPVQEEETIVKAATIQDVLTQLNSGKLDVTIQASHAMEEAKISTLTDKVIIDIPNSKCLLNPSIVPIENTYVKGIRTSQFTADTTRIVLDLKIPVELTKQYTAGRDRLSISLAPIGGVNNNGEANNTSDAIYRFGNKPTVYLKGVTSSKIKVTDDYRNRTLIFDLGSDYSTLLPNTELKPNDSAVSGISITTNGTTKIKVVTKRVYAWQIKQSDTTAVIEFITPKEKYKKIVVVDIGHGGSDSGAVGNGLTEKVINFNQGMALYKLLEADANIKVYMTRETDVYPTLQFRSQLANDIEADLFISLHNNSASSNVTGTETLYFPSTTDLRSKTIASLVQSNIVKNCQTVNRGIKPRSDLYVLRTTNMPAILIETGFISNAAEAQLINSPIFIQKWAKAVYDAVVEGFTILQR